MHLTLFRYYVISLLLNPFRPIAFWIIAAAPEFLAGIDALLGNALNHGFAAQGTNGRIRLDALLLAIGQSLCCQPLCETSFHPEYVKLAFYLTAQHQYQTVTKHQQTIGYYERIIAVKPLVELMFLGKDMNTALVQYIIYIVGFVEAEIADSLMLRRVN